MSSWERKRSPKPPNGFDSSHSCLIEADVAEQRGGGLVNRIMPVQVRPSALVSVPMVERIARGCPKALALVRLQVGMLIVSMVQGIA